MAEQMPLLLEHLDSRGLPPEILACDFFLSLGCRALPPLSVLRVLDIVFWQGGDTLQYVALAVLHLAEVYEVCTTLGRIARHLTVCTVVHNQPTV